MLDRRAVEIRIAWLALGVLLAVLFWSELSPAWLAFTLPAWLAGATLLGVSRWSDTIADRWFLALRSRPARSALVVAVMLLLLAAYVFSPPAAVFALLYASLAATLIALRAAAPTLSRSLVRTTSAAAALAALLGTLEAILHLDFFEVRLGLPDAIATSTSRHDHLERRNLFGFRSPYERVAHQPGTFRIVALGDSYTFGDHIARAESVWPGRLESMLRQRHPRPRFEVINMAAGWYTTANEAELLRRIGWQFAPDLLVLQFYVNDALASGPNFQNVGTSSLDPSRHFLPVRFRTGPVGGSAVLDLAERLFLMARAGFGPRAQYSGLYADTTAVGFRQMRAALHEIADGARARHIPAVMMIFPHFEPGPWTEETYIYRREHRLATRIAEEAGLRVVDLTPVFAAAGGDWQRWWTTPYDSGANPEAHRVAAEVLLRELQRMGVLPWPPTPPPASRRTDRIAGAAPASGSAGPE